MITPTIQRTSTFISPLNTVYVTIDKKFYDSVTFESGITLYKDVNFHPEESAMLEGVVVSLPRGLIARADYAGMQCPLAVGDKVLMRYDVVYAYVDQPEGDTPIYKNIVLFEGQEYWKADIQKIFGIIKPDGIEMINGYVLCASIEDKTPKGKIITGSVSTNYNIDALALQAVQAGRKVPQAEKPTKMRVKSIGLPLVGSPSLSAQPGDTIYIMPGVAQEYTPNLETFYIIKQYHILAIEGQTRRKVK
jgi:hypothetical protein